MAAAGVASTYAPPVWTFLHDEQFQMPVDNLLTVNFPQKVHEYFACWETSIFLISLRRDAPYLVPYLPAGPTFFVRFPI